MSKIVVYTGVYNEIRFVDQMIQSVLNQTHSEFDFYISDNHSTDGTSDAIRHYASLDRRIKVISPPSHLSSLDHGQFLITYLKGTPCSAAQFLGGHDLISADYLEKMLEGLNQNPTAAIAYPKNAYEIDHDNKIIKKWGSSPQTIGVPQPFKTIMTLLTLTYNVPLYGLWRYEVFKRIENHPRCIGGDHLFVAYATCHGDLVEISEGGLFLRQATGVGDINTYQEKHLGSVRNTGDDFIHQLKLLSEMIDTISQGQSPEMRDAIRASAILMYISRHSYYVTKEEDRRRLFLDPTISAVMNVFVESGGVLRTMLDQFKPASS